VSLLVSGMNRSRILTAAALACLLHVPTSLADPLHKSGADGAWRHHGSGWIYPRQLGGLELAGPPYTFDGNDDVGARYTATVDGQQRAAFVDVYYPDSAATGAKLDTAREAAKQMPDGGKLAQPIDERPFDLPSSSSPELRALKITYVSTGTAAPQTALYFVRTAAWVVTIRTTAAATDNDASKAMDAFVRALPWNSLGTDFHTPYPSGS
jgi:hypothetical protein